LVLVLVLKKYESLGLGLGLEIKVLVLVLVLTKKSYLQDWILIRHHKHAQNYYYSIKQVKLISYLSIHETTCLSFAIYMNQF